MSSSRGARPKSPGRTSARGAKKARRRSLEALIEEATVDCYNHAEALKQEHDRYLEVAKNLCNIRSLVDEAIAE